MINKIACFSLLVAASCPVNASNWSASVAFGTAETKLAQTHTDIQHADTSSTSWQVGVHYHLPKLTLDLAYIDLGEGEVGLESGSYTPEQYHQTVAEIAPILPEGWALGASIPAYKNERIFLDAQIGMYIWQNEIASSSASTGGLKTSNHGSDGYVGGQVGYQLHQKLNLALQYRKFLLDKSVDNISVSLEYYF
ncbi:porin family protein [Catenovulum sediminis]|uniref:porin family protein n=1 Tax=Catenovulum sediminis TaxID=1740262 RepID=UPI00117DD4D4|nr:porin family protein [Catenovulum sediminis]